MELRDYLRALRRSRRLIVALILLGALVGGAVGALVPHRYTSTARAYVAAATDGSLTDLTTGATLAQQAAGGYSAIATTAYVLNPVIERLGLTDTSAQLAGRVVVTAAADSQIIDITVTDPSSDRAARIANAIVGQLSSAALDLTSGSGAAVKAGTIQLTQVDPAEADSTPVGPGPIATVLLGALAGLVLASVLAVLRELLDTRVRTREDLDRTTEAPVLGITLYDPKVARRPLVVDLDTTGPRAEGYRTLRTNLRFVELDPATRSLVVTSSIDGEGKSVTAANLALAIAGLGRRVLLVDADLRRPRVARYFGVEGSVGLTNVLIGSVDLADAVQSFGDGRLDLLPSGSVPPNPNEQLQSQAMRDLVHRLHREYDMVLFDTPPLLAVSDAVVLGKQAGAVLVVAASGRVRRQQLATALDSLDRVGARIAGVVLTMAPRAGQDGAPYGYGHTESHTERETARSRRRASRREATAMTADAGAVVIESRAAQPAADREPGPDVDPALSVDPLLDLDTDPAVDRGRRGVFGRRVVEPVSAQVAEPADAAPVVAEQAASVPDGTDFFTAADPGKGLRPAALWDEPARVGPAAHLWADGPHAWIDPLEVSAPRAALRDFTRPAVWNDASPLMPAEHTVAAVFDQLLAPEPVAPDAVVTQVEAEPEARVAARRRFTGRARPRVAAVEDEGRSVEPIAVPIVDAEPQPRAVSADEAQPPALSDAGISVEQLDAMLLPDAANGRSRKIKERRPAPAARSAAKPVRVPPPPDLVARLRPQPDVGW